MKGFTVVMPMRNAAAYVEAALRSVLDQTGVDLEVVVVDDGSTDDSRARVEALGDDRVRIVDGPRQGIAAAFNTGLEAARGEYFARCDADDLYPPGRLEAQAAWLDAHPEFGAVCGYFAVIDEKGRFLTELARRPRPMEITEELRAGDTRTHFCTWAARTDLVRSVGGCRPWFVTAEDIDLQLRLGGRARVGYEPRLCYSYRIHGASITHTQAEAKRRFYESMARHFVRQRRDAGADDLERGRAPEPPDEADGSTPFLAEQVQGFLNARAWSACLDGRRRDALVLGARACLVRPARPVSWVNLLKLGARCLVPRAADERRET